MTYDIEDMGTAEHAGFLKGHRKCEERVRDATRELIAEIVEDLTLNHPLDGFKYTRNELIEKWEGRK